MFECLDELSASFVESPEPSIQTPRENHMRENFYSNTEPLVATPWVQLVLSIDTWFLSVYVDLFKTQ